MSALLIQGRVEQQSFLNFVPITQGHRESARDWLTQTREDSAYIIEYLDDWVLLEREKTNLKGKNVSK